MTKGIKPGGIVEFCDILKVNPRELFRRTRQNDTRLTRGIVSILMKRDGYTTSQIGLILSADQPTIKRYIEFATEQLNQRNPIAQDRWKKVKHLSFVKNEDVRNTYKRDLENIKVSFRKDKFSMLTKIEHI